MAQNIFSSVFLLSYFNFSWNSLTCTHTPTNPNAQWETNWA